MSGGKSCAEVTGVIGLLAGLGRTSAYWHLVFWDPWWLIGGLLFG